MRTLFLVVFICIGQLVLSQRSPYSFQVEAGASSYTNSPVIGLVLQVDTTDETHPITITGRVGVYKNAYGSPNAYWTAQLGLAYNFKNHVSVGCFPWYTIAYWPKTDFRIPMAVFVQYKKTPKFALRIEGAYFFGENNRTGIQATLNYKITSL